MIFVTVGSQKFQFNRLLKKIDELIGQGIIKEEVFAQTGSSDYQPVNYKYTNYLDRNEFAKRMSESDIVITHGGTGAIIGAVKQGKKVITVPRLAKFGEHVDDHQLQLIQQFEELNLIYACDDCHDLEKAIKEIKDMEFEVYKSNTYAIINSVERFIQENER